MADERAMLEILLEASKAKAGLADLKKTFEDSMRAAQAAVNTVDMPDEEVARLKNEAAAAGQALVKGFNDAKRSVNAAEDAVELLNKDLDQQLVHVDKSASGFAALAKYAKLAVGAFVGSRILQEVRDLASEAVAAQIAVQNINNALLGATGSADKAASEFDFLVDTTRELGVSLDGSGGAFARLTAAARGTALEGQKTRDIFSAMAATSTTLGLNADQTKDAIRALEQMISKNVISAEELRLQLGDHVPGAMSLMAKAAGVSVQELAEMLKNGELLAEDVLPKFAEELRKAFGPGTASAMASMRAGLQRLRNEMLLAGAEFADGFAGEVATGSNEAAKNLAGLSDELRGLGEAAGEGIGILSDSINDALRGLNALGDVLDFVGKHPLAGLVDGFTAVQREILTFANPVTAVAQAMGVLASAVDKSKDVLALWKSEIGLAAVAMGHGSAATTELGAKSRDLSVTTAELQAHRERLAAAERDLLSAMRQTREELEQQVEWGKRLAGEWNAQAEAEQAMAESLRGNNAEFDKRAELFAAEVAAMQAHGEINAANVQRISDEAEALLKLAERYGFELPESLQTLQAQYGFVVEAQKAVATTANEAADAVKAAADSTTEYLKKQYDDLAAARAKNVAEIEAMGQAGQEREQDKGKLREQIAELENATSLTLEQSERLNDLKGQLSDLGSDIFASGGMAAAGLDQVADAAEPAAVNMAGLVAEMERAGHVFDGSSGSLSRLHPEFDKLNDRVADTFDSFEDGKVAVQGAGDSFLQLAKGPVKGASDAVAGLAANQADFNLSVADGADAVAGLGTAAGKTAEELASLQESNPAAYVDEMAKSFDKSKAAAAAFRAEIAILNDEQHLKESLRLAQELKQCLEEAGA